MNSNENEELEAKSEHLFCALCYVVDHLNLSPEELPKLFSYALVMASRSINMKKSDLDFLLLSTKNYFSSLPQSSDKS